MAVVGLSAGSAASMSAVFLSVGPSSSPVPRGWPRVRLVLFMVDPFTSSAKDGGKSARFK